MRIISFDEKYSKQIIGLWLSDEVTKQTLSTKERSTVKRLNERCLEDKKNTFIALEKEKVIGFSSMRLGHGRRNHCTEFVIFVAKEFQRNGVATAIMKKLFARAKKNETKEN